MNYWEKDNYQRIVSVENSKGKIIVKFADESIVEIPLSSLVPSGFKPDGTRLVIHNEFEVIIPGEEFDLEIPWDNIRVISDQEFSRFLASQAADQARVVGQRLKQLREKKGIKAGGLAERSGLTPQTITRIEKGYTDLSFVSLKKILASMGYTLKDLANEEQVTQTIEKSYSTLTKRLSKIGIDTSFVLKRILPRHISTAIQDHNGKAPQLLLDELTSYLTTIFGWSSNDIWSDKPLEFRQEVSMPLFKKPSNANENQVRAYSHYAYYIAKTVLKAKVEEEQKKSYPTDWEDFKNTLVGEYNGLSIDSILSYTWDLGICVIPLNDPGTFHGASWNIDGQHVIILKQTTEHHAKWIYNLLHELYHVFYHLEESNTSVIELEEVSPFPSNDSIEEREANSFANLVLFGTNAEELAQDVVKAANWKTELLKSAIQKVASEKKVRVDFLANYIAYRLSVTGQNWWGTANNLQVIEPNPYQVSISSLEERINPKKLSPIEFNVLDMALNNRLN